ncbi:MAG: site-2 protease family protein, partial [Gemmiger sp.]|nr:site-2 protease family protein [Gemmiger sp.]
DFIWYLISMNISLAVFNLLPVPPFDGSRIALLFLPQKYYFRAMQYERYIMLGVLALVMFGVLNTPLGLAVNAVWHGMYSLTGFVELGFGL